MKLLLLFIDCVCNACAVGLYAFLQQAADIKRRLTSC